MSALGSVLAHLRLLRLRSAPAPPPSPVGRGGRRGEGVSSRGIRFSHERLARLRQLIGASSDGFLPPIAVQLLASPLHLELLGDADFPLRALGLVHVRNTIDEHRALGDELALDLDAFVESIVRTPRGDEVTLVTEARVAGELVYRASTTALRKAKHRTQRSEARTPRAAPEGEPLRRVVFDVPEAMGRRYARVAGDLNPIHQHAWLARPFGFPRAIVHGTWTLSRAIEAARAELPAYPRTIECSFRQPVMLPSSVAIEVRRAEGELRLRVTAAQDTSFEHLGVRVAGGGASSA
jgi:acyl dehydratase